MKKLFLLLFVVGLSFLMVSSLKAQALADQTIIQFEVLGYFQFAVAVDAGTAQTEALSLPRVVTPYNNINFIGVGNGLTIFSTDNGLTNNKNLSCNWYYRSNQALPTKAITATWTAPIEITAPAGAGWQSRHITATYAGGGTITTQDFSTAAQGDTFVSALGASTIAGTILFNYWYTLATEPTGIREITITWTCQ